MVVRVLVAGGTGVIGRRLVPQLVARGHQVAATMTSGGAGQRVASLSRGVRRGQTAAAGPSVAGPAAGRRDDGGHKTKGRGFCNAKAKRELGWELRYPSWRQGFRKELA